MTLVEVVIAMGCAAFMSAGVYGIGTTVMRYSHQLRFDAEAQAFAKEALEEIIAVGLDDVKKPGFSYLSLQSRKNPSTNVTMQRKARVIYHNADAAVVAVDDPELAYAEVHIDVSYRGLYGKNLRTVSYSTLVN